MSNEQKQLIREKIEETLKNPPTWTDGDGRTQAERIMDILDLAIKQTEERIEKIPEKENLKNKVWDEYAEGYNDCRRDIITLIRNK